MLDFLEIISLDAPGLTVCEIDGLFGTETLKQVGDHLANGRQVYVQGFRSSLSCQAELEPAAKTNGNMG